MRSRPGWSRAGLRYGPSAASDPDRLVLEAQPRRQPCCRPLPPATARLSTRRQRSRRVARHAGLASAHSSRCGAAEIPAIHGEVHPNRPAITATIRAGPNTGPHPAAGCRSSVQHRLQLLQLRVGELARRTAGTLRRRRDHPTGVERAPSPAHRHTTPTRETSTLPTPCVNVSAAASCTPLPPHPLRSGQPPLSAYLIHQP